MKCHLLWLFGGGNRDVCSLSYAVASRALLVSLSLLCATSPMLNCSVLSNTKDSHHFVS